MPGFLEHVEGAGNKAVSGQLCYRTMDTFLIYKLTEERSYKTDDSNASRTQLFNVATLSWDSEICTLFHIPMNNLPKVCDSNANYGESDFAGVPVQVPSEEELSGIGVAYGAGYALGLYDRGSIQESMK